MTKYIAIFEVEDDWNIQTIDADVTYTYESNGTYYGMREGIEFEKEKTGKWESTEIFYGGESKGAIIKCSECGNEFKVSPKVFENLYGNERFCNYCGVRMVSE